MLFVSWPGHFQLLLFSNVYGKFILCLCSNHGTLEAHHCFTCIIVPISMHSFILWSLSAHLKSTIFNFPVLKIPASLEDSEFCQSFFFFSLRLFYYLSNLWVRQTSWSSICYHSNHTPGNKSSSQLFCIFFYVSYDGVC